MASSVSSSTADRSSNPLIVVVTGSVITFGGWAMYINADYPNAPRDSLTVGKVMMGTGLILMGYGIKKIIDVARERLAIKPSEDNPSSLSREKDYSY